MSISKIINHKSKIVFCFLFSAFCFNCFAQSKFGHVDYGEIMRNMQGIDSIQNVVINYAAGLQAVGEQMVKEFKEKEAAFERLANTPGTSQAVLKIRQDELGAILKRIQEFAQSMEADIQDKQLELLEPFKNRLLDAIRKVAKVNHYNYIFDITTLMFSSPTDDLTVQVKAELGIK